MRNEPTIIQFYSNYTWMIYQFHMCLSAVPKHARHIIVLGYIRFFFWTEWDPEQNGRYFADEIFKCIFLREMLWFGIKYHWTFFLADKKYNWTFFLADKNSTPHPSRPIVRFTGLLVRSHKVSRVVQSYRRDLRPFSYHARCACLNTIT